MGAAGNVTIYDYDAVVAKHAELHGGKDVHDDWWYLSRPGDPGRGSSLVVTLGGKHWIVDYSDDQGWHEGTGNNFWFENEEAHQRVRATLQAVGWADVCEVWT